MYIITLIFFFLFISILHKNKIHCSLLATFHFDAIVTLGYTDSYTYLRLNTYIYRYALAENRIHTPLPILYEKVQQLNRIAHKVLRNVSMGEFLD